ncbi:MAG: hypothetical protein V7L23_09750 [Nostoc sp.]
MVWDKQGKQGKQNSTPASISLPAQEQLASTKKFQNLRSIGGVGVSPHKS